ncbi:MAG: TonB-dependent receptor [Verrucomicrobiales bacterium]|nr:TonB-dependent receptor [Verrucomicrobiales bacterium]
MHICAIMRSAPFTPWPKLTQNISPAVAKLVFSILCVGMAQNMQAQTNSTPATAVSALPEVTVTAQKLPQEVEVSPLSQTSVNKASLENSGARTFEDVAIYSPSLYFPDFAPRRNSVPRFRGIGGSPNNPAVTTMIDGVPQFNSNSGLQELVAIDHIDFLRGPQSTLFGRNTLGGLISV